MSLLKDLMDSYDRRARLYPALLVFLPLGLGVCSWIPMDLEFMQTLAGIAVSLGGGSFLAQLARDLGKKKEAWLFESWGGKPSVQFLSYRFDRMAPQTLARCHEKLRKMDPNLTLPRSAEEEADAPEKAWAAYESANDLLLARTRGHEKFAILFDENISYGYRRNLWGMKPAGIFCSLVGFAAGASRFGYVLYTVGQWSLPAIVATVVSVFLLVLWSIRITPIWVKVSAEAFARQLLLACDEIEVG